MNLPMLAVDSNNEFSQREQAAWLAQGIATVRAYSMQEAIEELGKREFFFVAINADNIKYLPLLRVMRDVTPLLIFVAASDPATHKHTEAVNNGADFYFPYLGSPEENVGAALAMINRHNERTSQPRKPVRVVSYHGLLIYPKLRRIFYRDTEIDLTKTEYAIFNCLLANANQTMPHDLLYRKVWNKEYDDAAGQALWQHISRIKKKFTAVGHDGVIEVKRSTGYRLSTIPRK